MQTQKIVFLASDCESSRWVYNALKQDFTFAASIIEQPVSKKILFKNRMKKIGFLKVLGQAMFSALIVPILKNNAKKQKAKLVNQHNLSITNFDGTVINVPSVNDDLCKMALINLQPDIVLVNGTRIISKKVLQCTNATFINMHAGITPYYRGSHGGYWALYNNDVENFGTTIHLVDTGVDTGGILKQAFIKPAKEDNFTTYPILQTIIGIEALKTILVNNKFSEIKNTHKGKLYYQPTILEYFFK
jgi:methionyl-tRNA formyltransferase